MKSLRLVASRILAIMAMLASAGCVSQSTSSALPSSADTIVAELPIAVENPYALVDWETTGRFKANFHAHTTASDGRRNPHEVVDLYHELGYSALALTDHNRVTYPWESLSSLFPSNWAINQLKSGRRSKLQTDYLDYQDRKASSLDMAAIQGNELSSHHHMGSFFTDHNGTKTVEDSLQAIGERNGLAMFFHPGRYNWSASQYADYYRRYPQLVGMEIYNQGDRYPGDRDTWDRVLTELMPTRPVWGFSNDDSHMTEQIGLNWNVMLLPELSEQWARKGMEQGRFYFVHAPHGHSGAAPPIIDSITVNHDENTIRIEASNCRFIEWISNGNLLTDEGGESGGEVIHRGAIIHLERHRNRLGTYVRAVLHGADGTVAGTQPFAIYK